MQGHFDPATVVLSVLIALLSVYVALDLTGRVAASGGAVRYAWVLAGALATGVGIWTMHFTGMLALRLPVTMRYEVSGVAISLIIAIAASTVSLTVAATRRAVSVAVFVAGLLLGLGMGAMHVVAMSSMRMAATPTIDVRLIALSMAMAIFAGVLLVSFASRLRSDETLRGWRHRALAALVIGPMIAAMHYTAMAGTSFAPGPMPATADQTLLLATQGLAYTAVASCLLMVLLALGGAAVDRTLQRRLLATSEHARLQSEAESARDSAQAANKAKSEFLAAMSHELRTPLNAIAGYTELLQIGVHGPLNDKQQEDLARIQRSQKHLLSLINDVLNFAKLEAGKVQLKPHLCRVEQLTSTVEAMIAPQLRSRALHFTRQSDANVPEVFCDPDKTEQVLLNLLSNAAKFTAAGGTIEMSAHASPTGAQIAVRDTGVGIPADKLDVIFEPFVQVERNLTQNIDGAGLGLAISRDLARAMGGDLTVESKVGVGSTFTLTLPTSNASETSRAADSTVSIGRHSSGSISGESRAVKKLGRDQITR
jgi:signal transduction histidine kinase